MKERETGLEDFKDSKWGVFLDVIYLCSCAVNCRIPDSERIKSINLEELYLAADQHMLTATVAAALESAKVYDKRFLEARAKAIRKTAIMDEEQRMIFARLEDANIWYLPLKGTVLKDLYPIYGIRQMSDRDILVDKSRMSDVREIMESLGYNTEDYGRTHHDCYIKPPVSNFEMHRELFGITEGKRINDYYADIKSRLIKDEGNNCGWHFKPEDFYLHMVTHEYKHYANNGTGLRSLLDTYVYLNRMPLNMNEVTSEAEKLGIAAFEYSNRILAQHLFDGVPLMKKEQQMLKRFLRSGTYGKAEHAAANQVSDMGRGKYFLSRLTLPYEVMQYNFPILKKMPFLYPFLWSYRLVAAVLFKREKVKHQVKTMLSWKEE